MSERDLHVDAPPTAEELDQARRLADAIEGSGRLDVDPEALAVVRLLEAVAERQTGDEIARRRLRNELVAAASRRHKSTVGWRLGAVAAALGVVAVSSLLVVRSGGRPTDAVLTSREQAARAAVASIEGSRTTVGSLDSRLTSALDGMWRTRLATEFDNQRFTALASLETAAVSSPGATGTLQPSLVVPTPGGLS